MTELGDTRRQKCTGMNSLGWKNLPFQQDNQRTRERKLLCNSNPWKIRAD
jgi:hypothetical protein